MLGTYHLNGLFDVLKELHFFYEPNRLWKYVLEQSCKYLQAEAGTFFLASPDESGMEVTAAYGADEERLKQLPFRRGVGICGWVLQYHQPALVMDVSQDHRFNRSVDAVTGVNTESLLCVPVLSQKRMYGVIELINRKSGQFNPQDQEFMTVLGRQTAIAYQNLLFVNELTQAKTLLQGVIENLSGGLIIADPAGKILIMNPVALRVLNIPSPAVGKPVKDVLKEYAWFGEKLSKTLNDKSTVSRQEVTFPIQGQEARIGYSTLVILDEQKNLLGSGIIFQQLPKN
jgi:signal transduction protein with GAF and PtsI domain